ncbi:hypothetical protein [Amycolatopsis sp. BJA-103]|uniref:hypothetical protein n=1 Tax=Amycolatopsis sp. BJA-103 TaxID=1911175 RepID=UPI000C7783B8|nr:hypothetical protein [Amycolatopsis sp. BJA-103]AUI57329.1 hypothetical protein BKN51_03265 [Amycolatopsis sp. BJA-103]PNE13241.1 hypothetical protein B1H26_41350 [Amycolatopsis sp. BJA-103]
MSKQSVASAGTAMTEYVVVLRARSAARFLPEEGFQLVVNVPKLDIVEVRIRTFTRWVEENGRNLPRELVIEVRGHASSLDEAVAKFTAIARPFATMVGFVANVRVGPLELHLAFDCTPTGVEREFLEAFVPDEQGGVSQGRIIQLSHFEAACRAFVTLATDSSRVDRALRQYELALREWYVGGEWLALNHLWIAAENLTKAVIRNTVTARGISEDVLARELGLVTDDPKRPRWKEFLGARVRKEIIFTGDDETYTAAKDASDALEHGYWELDKVATNALKSADKTFHYVRQSIVDLLGLAPEVANELNEIKPKDVQSMRKVVRGLLIGAAEDAAAEGELYPRLEWTSGIESVVREGATFHVKPQERITVRTHPDVGFRMERLEVYGRLENGEVRVRLSDDDVAISHTAPSPSRRLLGSVMPVINAAAASGADKGHTRASLFAFNMFGQAVASFKSIQVLVGARQPVEALPILRALVIIAGRFEQMTDPSGPGLGIAVRGVLDALEALDVGANLTETRRTEFLAAAQNQGLTIPDELAAPETTSIYASLGVEMKFAAEAANGTSGLHLQRVDAERLGFQVTLEPGPLTDMVSTGAVVAMLELLKQAASLFGWTLQSTDIDQLLGEARAVNESAAQLDLVPPASAMADNGE